MLNYISEVQFLMFCAFKCLEKYKMQTRMTEQECGTVLEEEAKLMSYHLSVLAKDDPFGMNLNVNIKYLKQIYVFVSIVQTQDFFFGLFYGYFIDSFKCFIHISLWLNIL